MDKRLRPQERKQNSLKAIFASCLDDIPARILKECGKEISPSLCALFNHSLRTGRFPAEWKNSDVTPVHKKDLKERAENYRPISLLPIVSKVMDIGATSSIIGGGGEYSYICVHRP
jgi:hypothetical protein